MTHSSTSGSKPKEPSNSLMTVDYVQAQRRKIERELEILIALQAQIHDDHEIPAPTPIAPGAIRTSQQQSVSWPHMNESLQVVEEPSISSASSETSSFSVVQEPVRGSASVVSLDSSEDQCVLSSRLCAVLPDLDMTNEALPDLDNEVPVMSAAQTKPTRKRKAKSSSSTGQRKLGRPSAFPQKLYRMLMDIQTNGSSLQDIVAFSPEGNSFHIYHNDAFVEQILPKYFKMSSFSSFQRQLQLYSFKRISKGGAYFHPMFHRENPDTVGRMVRKQSKPSNFLLAVAAKTA
ncbi:shock factor protein 1 [Seminavis robusta]|uniref:Shock factor protein 1 n=1 Tax=Seminavis robusta TaxID=568900 RepID=A0A9N8E1F3_9STRA|nr:shock factor protein 1 [Seminavis robusta]|eukprot:Sro554_g165580.1 shock factor protein 1 (290) ;mRNA; f:53219-54387